LSSPNLTLTIAKPDDWHLHLRDGAELASVVGYSARVFRRAIVMPNLKPPVTTVALAARYRDRIRAALPAGSGFEPLMTLYLTDSTDPAEIDRAAESRFVAGIKCYPAGATTHSDAGVTSFRRCEAAIARMEERGVVLQVHAEATGDDIDPFDRESIYIDRELAPLVARHPRLRVVLEHVTTRAGVEFVRSADTRIGATITPQHLLYNRGALFRGGLRPHLFCLPVLKRERDRQALVEAATSGDARFFLGTDSAPHERYAKEAACGCAGIFSAPAAIELYARAFEEAGRLDRLEAFAGFHGADFYGLPRNREKVTLQRRNWIVPASLTFGAGEVVPMCAGEPLAWSVAGANA
jgi:dihydroorotase